MNRWKTTFSFRSQVDVSSKEDRFVWEALAAPIKVERVRRTRVLEAMQRAEERKRRITIYLLLSIIIALSMTLVGFGFALFSFHVTLGAIDDKGNLKESSTK